MSERKYADHELLDFLDSEKNGVAVIEDDNGHWCVATDGFQQLVAGDEPQNFGTQFMVPGKRFGRKTIREAIEAYMADQKDYSGESYEEAVNEAYRQSSAAKQAELEQRPEATCSDCGGPNITWFIANDIWNKVMGSPDGIVCPVCFVKRAESAGMNSNAWELKQETV